MALNPQHAVATADGAGDATFTFADVPVGELWTGTTNIPDAPPAHVGTVTGGGELLGQMYGPGSYGPWTCGHTQKLVISSTGLTPGVQYEAVWHADDRGHEVATYPAPITPTTTTSVSIPTPVPVSQATTPWIVAGTVNVGTVAGTVTTLPTLAPAAPGGSTAMTGSPVTLPSHAAVQGVVLSSPTSNGHSITVNGYTIDPGQTTPLLPVDNSDVFTATGTSGDVLSFLVT